MAKKNGKIPRSNLTLARITAIRAHAHGHRSIDIAKMLGVHPVTVSRWIRLHKEGGALSLRTKKSSGRPRKIDCSAYSKELLKIVMRPATKFGFENPLWTTARIREAIRIKLRIDLSCSTVWRELRRIGLSHQVPTTLAFEADDRKRNEWIGKIWPKIRRKAKKERAVILFEDESTVQLTPNRGKTWAKIGKTPTIKLTGKRGSFGLMSAISPAGKLLFKMPGKRVTSAVFIDFIKQILREIPRKKIYLIVDNGPVHTSKKTFNFVATVPRLELIFLPPYSPDFNPTELAWAHLKSVDLKAHTETTKAGLEHKTRAKMRSLQKKKRIVSSFYKKAKLT